MYVWNVGGIQQGGATKTAVKKTNKLMNHFQLNSGFPSIA